jgi:outer membrane protein assembly factor BamB
MDSFSSADYDNINKENIPLIDNWGDGPKIEWTVDLGEGHAAPVIYNGKVYILDYNELRKRDALRCFSLKTGEELWRRSYNVHVKRNHGMSRTVPAINEKYILTIGPRCHVMCTDPNNGDLLWGIDLVKEYNTEIPFWYTGQCPMIDGDLAILAPGGTSLIIAVDLATGKVVWETLNPDNWQMSHSSIMPMTLNGKKMYVYAAVGGICGISAEGDDRGKILWKTIDFSPTVVAPSPLILDNGNIFMTAGYGAGAILFNVAENNGAYSVKVIQKYIPKDGIGSEQQTPLLFNGRMFAILPKDAGGMRNQFVCCDPNDGKNILWTSGKEDRFGLGPYAIADGKFFILNDDGTLTIAKASTERFIFLDKAKIIDGMDAWGPLAFADGYLIMRDSKTMVCLNIMKD